MFEWKASNAILMDEVPGKGRAFRCKFLEAGLVKYSFGVCLLPEEALSKFAYNFVGCPVIINHQDLTEETADEARVGVISEVTYSDGWYWCNGIIFDNEAIELIKKGFNVSCQYEITEYAENKEGKLHNGNPYDKIILDGKPEHLAIVEHPRYENAMIAVNAIEVSNEDKFISVGPEGDKHPINLDYEKEIKQAFDNLKIGIKHFNNKGNYNVNIIIDRLNLDKKINKISSIFGGKNISHYSISEFEELVNIETKDFFDKKNLKKEEKNNKTEPKKEKETTQLKLDLDAKNNIKLAINELKDAILNAINDKWITIHPNGEDNKGKHLLLKDGETPKEAIERNYGKKENKKDNEMYQKMITYSVEKELRDSVIAQKHENPDAEIGDTAIDSDRIISLYVDKLSPKEYNKFDWDKAEDFLFNKLKEIEKEQGFKENKIAKNDIIEAINDIKETDMFKSLFKKENDMTKDEIKEIFKECLAELKASNEAEEEVKEEEKAENEVEEKAEEKDVEEKAENEAEEEEKAENECDYKKMYEELKAKVDAEAENKCKNEDEEKDDEKEEEKAQNSINEQTKALFGNPEDKVQTNYISKAKAIELGSELY